MTERFELLAQLGRGGMGTVWKARDSGTGEIVALKLLHQMYVDDPDYVARFEREVEIAKRIDSPYVVKVLGFGRREGIPFVAMECVEGASLREKLKAEGPVGWNEAKRIATQIATALAAAHAAGVIHRDIKPSNVLLDPDGNVKLADFGIARATDLTRMTGSVTVLGTPAYMSPDGEANEQSDIYALGCVLFEMLTGSPPFEGESQQQVLLKHIREAPNLDRLPSSARRIVGWLLEKDPRRRPPSAEALLAVLQGSSIRATGQVVPPRPPRRTGRWVAAGVMGVSVLGLAGLVAFAVASLMGGADSGDDGDTNAGGLVSGTETASPTPTNTEPATRTPTATATPDGTATPTPSAPTPSGSASATSSQTATPTPTPTPTGTPTPTPTATHTQSAGDQTLLNGVPLPNQVVAEGEWRYYSISAPAGPTGISVTLLGTGDVDLFIRGGSKPTLGTFDCASNSTSSNETCTRQSSGGIWWIGLFGYSGGTVTVIATFGGAVPTPTNTPTPPPSGPDQVLTSGGTLTGEVISEGQWRYYSISTSASPTKLTVTTSGTGDIDLFLRAGAKPTLSEHHCASQSGTSSEVCTQTASGGIWWIGLFGYSGGTVSITATLGGSLPSSNSLTLSSMEFPQGATVQSGDFLHFTLNYSTVITTGVRIWADFESDCASPFYNPSPLYYSSGTAQVFIGTNSTNMCTISQVTIGMWKDDRDTGGSASEITSITIVVNYQVVP